MARPPAIVYLSVVIGRGPVNGRKTLAVTTGGKALKIAVDTCVVWKSLWMPINEVSIVKNIGVINGQ